MSIKRFTRFIGAAMVAVCCWVGTAAAQVAQDVIALVNTINSVDGLTAQVWEGAATPTIVSVTGTAVNNAPLTLNFPTVAGVTVRWMASLTGSVNSGNNGLIHLIGDGTFEVTTGGEIVQTNSASASRPAISAGSGGSVNWTGTIIVSGSGTVEAKHGNDAISASGTGNDVVIVKDNSRVTADGGRAIGASGNVTVTDNALVTTAGTAASTAAAIHIRDDGNGNKVTVSGSAKVEATGNGGGNAISSMVDVEIKDNAQVTATTGYAVHLSHTSGKTLTVGDSAKVAATGDSGVAIYSHADVTVTGNAQVTATTGNAIHADWNAAVTVSGGVVFAYGDGFVGEDNVIYLENGATFAGPTGNGIVIAWDRAAAGEDPTYDENTTIDLNVDAMPRMGGGLILPLAYWRSVGGISGILYANGTNTGFLAVPEATVIPFSASISLRPSSAHKKIRPADNRSRENIEHQIIVILIDKYCITY